MHGFLRQPLLSYEALLEIIHIYLVDVYAIAKHPTAEVSRLEIWTVAGKNTP